MPRTVTTPVIATRTSPRVDGGGGLSVKVNAVARCLARQDDEFVSAAEWASERDVLRTIANVEAGNHTGGLP